MTNRNSVDRPVPTTDDEVTERLKDFPDQFIRDTLSALYRCHRAQGETVLDSWSLTLRAYVAPETLPKSGLTL